MHGAPVVLEHTAGITRVGVPRPVGPADALLLDVRGELVDPASLDGVRADVLGAELADQDRCNVLLLDVAEALLPTVGEDRGHVRIREPRLGKDTRAVLMRRVDDAVGDGEADRVVADALEVAAPPVAVELLPARDGAFDALDDDQPVRGLGQHGIAATLGRAAPIVGATGAPGGLAMRLVLEVGADHVRRVGVARGQLAPGRHPIVLGVATEAVPERMHEGIVGRGVVVEDDHQALATSLRDDDVHHLLGRLALQLGVLAAAVIDATGGRRLEHLQRERHPDRVEAIRLDLGEHVLVVARPEAVRRVDAGLEAEPVDALQNDLVAGGVDDRAALRLEGQLRCGLCRSGQGQ